MPDYFALSQIFVEHYTHYGLKWPFVTLAGDETRQGSVIGTGTHYMIPRQGEVELKWVFDRIEVNPGECRELTQPVACKVCYDDYSRWAATFEQLGEERWLDQWLVETADRARDELCAALAADPAVKRLADQVNTLRLPGTPDYVDLQ